MYGEYTEIYLLSRGHTERRSTCRKFRVYLFRQMEGTVKKVYCTPMQQSREASSIPHAYSVLLLVLVPIVAYRDLNVPKLTYAGTVLVLKAGTPHFAEK